MLQAAKEGEGASPLWQRYGLMVALYSGIAIVVIALMHFPFATDYVGDDSDDVMRLVQVRNLIAGQGWFDLTQYRLGLEGGTPMHWSRLIDLPIAALILFFRLFLDPLAAEAWALAIWPLLLIAPMFAAMGLAGRRVGGPAAMHIALGLTALLVLSGNRFMPGAIDHHNVQLVLVAALAAMLVDPDRRPWSFVLAGAAAACAIAVGAETMPLVGAACGVVAVSWAVIGQPFVRAARAFALSLAAAVLLLFVATTPPHLYAVVACDGISIGYVGLAAIGGALLFLSTLVAGERGPTARFALLAVDGVLILAAALLVAPQCLRSPLADLDPLLVSHWLENVTEAQSVLDEVRIDPGLLGGYYAVGLFAISVCVFRMIRRDRVWLHATVLPLLLVAWGVALIQVRGSIFANLLSIIPLSLLISDLRSSAGSDRTNLRTGIAFLAAVLASVPSFWFVAGAMAAEGAAGLSDRSPAAARRQGGASYDCVSEAALAQLGEQTPTTVAAPPNSGAPILRFTEHRVLSAPYHRNQGGMLAELYIGLAGPDEAQDVLRRAKVGLIAFCRTDGQTRRLAERKPDGLYAALARGEVPPYLRALPTTGNSGLQLYWVDRPRE